MRCNFLLDSVRKNGRSEVIGWSFHEHPCQILAFCIQDSLLPSGDIGAKHKYMQHKPLNTRKTQAATPSCCWSTFHKAVWSLYSSSWLWVGHIETNPERHLLLQTGRHHKRPLPHVSLPGPEVSDSQLNTHRQTKVNIIRKYSLQAVIFGQNQVLLETASLIFSLLVSQFSAPHTPKLVLPKPTAATQGKSWKRGKGAFLTVSLSHDDDMLHMLTLWIP